jgi:glyoxylase-like metal-dependent hydrolase (beta-lactamase superfamily II)
MFDPASGLPARIRTLDYDAIQGNVAFDLVLSDWRDIDGVKLAHRHVYQLNGRTVVDTRFDSVKLNAAVGADRLAIPAAFKQQALRPGVTVPYQWVIRRQYAGTYLDSDMLAFDPAASQGLRLQDVGPGIALVQGGTHNSLIVELADQLVVFDAPIGDAYSQWVLKQAAQKWPGKPVRTLVLSHHHIDHSAGTRAYVAQGAALVVGAGNGAHFRRMLLAEHSRSPDLPAGLTREPRIVEVAERTEITDGKRSISVLALENPHSAGAVIGYIDDARLGFVTDLWSPGRDPLGKTQSAGQAAVVAAVNRYRIAPERFAGGHGSTGSYPELASLPPPAAPAAPAR